MREFKEKRFLKNHEFECQVCNRIKSKAHEAHNYKTGDRNKTFSLCVSCYDCIPLFKQFGYSSMKKDCSVCGKPLLELYGYGNYIVPHWKTKSPVHKNCIGGKSVIYLMYSETLKTYKIGRTSSLLTRQKSIRVENNAYDFEVIEQIEVLPFNQQHIKLETLILNFYTKRGYLKKKREYFSKSIEKDFKVKSFRKRVKQLIEENHEKQH